MATLHGKKARIPWKATLFWIVVTGVFCCLICNALALDGGCPEAYHDKLQVRAERNRAELTGVEIDKLSSAKRKAQKKEVRLRFQGREQEANEAAAKAYELSKQIDQLLGQLIDRIAEEIARKTQQYRQCFE